MSVISVFADDAWYHRWRELIAHDPELNVIGRRCTLTLALVADGEGRAFQFEQGRLVGAAPWRPSPSGDGGREAPGGTGVGAETLVVEASADDWAKVLRDPPAPGHTDLPALHRVAARAAVTAGADVLIRHLRALTRVVELARAATTGAGAEPLPPEREPDADVEGFEPLTGRYLRLTVRGERHRIYVEEAGSGVPLVCLHTAGADSRQYRHLLLDPEITGRFRVIAFDLPWHGRSLPPEGWWTREYRLTVEDYRETTMAVLGALGLESPVVVGCSMGGCLVLELARRHPGELRGVIGMSGAAKVAGRFGDWSIRPDVNATEAVPSWTYGLMAPYGPEQARREVWWTYSQGGPGIYRGDTYFYSEDFDLRGREHEIDTAACPVVLMTGEYDYVCTPADSEATARRIPGARFVRMDGIGHFPMAENYPLFRRYLLPELERFCGGPAT